MAKTLADMMEEVYDCNVTNGWYDDSRTFGDDIALLHSEVSEMLEAYRDSVADDVDVKGKPIGMASEAADILIRLLDTCKRQGIDLDAAYEAKLAYNRTRGYKHGGKAL